MTTMPKTEQWSEQINQVLSKAHMPERAPMPRAHSKLWDTVGGSVARQNKQSLVLTYGAPSQRNRCAMCNAELGTRGIADRFADRELFVQQRMRWHDQSEADASSASISIRVSQTPQELTDALDDLSEVLEEAEEKGYQIPTETAISEATRLLKTMYEIAPQRFEVYPMPDGKVTIDATNENGHYLMLLLSSDGSARCLTNFASGRSRRHFNTTDDIPHEFLRESMLEIDVSNG